ncbi:MAG: hypothetical protein H7Z14_06085 [Anaerolineae bacterium]|nr:hypothetical protein [Phycisphaerae bacterium]
MFSFNRRSGIGLTLAIAISLLCVPGSRAQTPPADPCAQLRQLAAELKTLADQVIQDVEDLAKADAEASKAPGAAPEDWTKIKNAVDAYDHLNTATRALKQFNESDDGRQLAKLRTDKAALDQTIKDGDAAENAARNKDAAKTKAVDDLKTARDAQQSKVELLDVQNSPKSVVDPEKAKLLQLQADYRVKYMDLYDSTTLKAMSDREAAKPRFKEIEPAIKELAGKQKLRDDAIAKANAELKPYGDLGGEAKVRAKYKELTDKDAAAGDLSGKAHKARLKLKEDQAKKDAAQEAHDALQTRLQEQAQTECQQARDDAFLSGVQQTIDKNRDDMKLTVNSQIKSRAIAERKAKPELWNTPAAKAASLDRWMKTQREECVQGFEAIKQAEIARLNRVKSQFLHLPCMPDEQQLTTEIDERITFVTNLRYASAGGVEDGLGQMPEIDIPDDGAGGGEVVAEEKTWKFDCRPGGWTSTGIMLTKDSSIAIKAEGKLTRGKDWSTGPGGYYHLGFQAWTFKAKVGKRLIDIGAGGTIWGEEGELLLAPTYTYDPAAEEGKTEGSITATVTGKGLTVDDAIASKGGKQLPPPDGKSTGGGGDGKTSGNPGAAAPGGNFRNIGDKEVIVACPVTMRITDSSGRRDSEIEGLTIESKPDADGGQIWYASLPKGEFTAHFTGTGKGAVHVRTKQRGKPDMTYPAFEVDKGSTASLVLSDSPEAPPLKTGSTRELTPTAGTGGTTTSGGDAASGGIAGQVSAGKNLQLARWTTFRRITDFPRGEGAQIVTVAKMSADGSRIVFGTGKGLFVMNTDGSDVRAIAQGTPISHVDISADGRKVAWFQRGEKSTLFTANSDGSDITPMPMNGASMLNAMRLTADGSRLFVISFEKAGIYMMPSDGSDLKRIVDTASVCKLLKTDENSNHWRNSMEISDDGSRIVFHLLWTVFGINSDGSDLHIIANRKTYGINGFALSGDGQTVAVHESSDAEKSGTYFHGFDGREVSRFKTNAEDVWSMHLASDGGRVFTSPGVRVFSADGKTFHDPCDTGPNLWANPMLIGVSRDGTRACLRIDGPESTDQGRPHQFVMVEFNPARTVAGVPTLIGASASPKFFLADGSSNVMATIKSNVEEPRSVGAVLVINGARPRNIANMSFAMNDTAADGDAAKEDGTYTSSSVNGRTYDGKPLPAGPIMLRVHVLDKDWNLTVADFEGLEVRTP